MSSSTSFKFAQKVNLVQQVWMNGWQELEKVCLAKNEVKVKAARLSSFKRRHVQTIGSSRLGQLARNEINFVQCHKGAPHVDRSALKWTEHVIAGGPKTPIEKCLTSNAVNKASYKMQTVRQ